MAAPGKIGDWAFKAFSAGLGVATIYLTATFSVNVYRGLAWHKAQTKAEEAAMLQKAEEEEAMLQKAAQGLNDQNDKQA